MNTFAKAMESAGMRPVDFRNLMEELTGWKPSPATLSRWMRAPDPLPHDSIQYAIALVRLYDRLAD